MKRTGICLIAGLLLAALPLVMNAEKAPFYYGHSRELHASVYQQEENSGIKEGDMYFLSWDEMSMLSVMSWRLQKKRGPGMGSSLPERWCTMCRRCMCRAL